MAVDILGQLRNLLDRTLSLNGRGLTLSEDAELLGSLPELDSVGVIAVITALEERFGFTVEDDEISADTFASMAALIEYVQSKL